MKLLPISLTVLLALSGCSDSDDPVVMPVNDEQTPLTPEMPGESQTPEAPPVPPASGSIASGLVNQTDADGSAQSAWDCVDQNGEDAVSFIFFDDFSGVVLTSEDGPLIDMTWSESAGDSIILSIATAGDSQLQTISFTDAENFTTTDSSIAGQTPGPLECEFVDLSEGGDEPGAGAGEGAGEGAGNGGPGIEPQTALDEALEEALNEADGTESAVALINSTLPGAQWSCTSTGANSFSAYSLTFSADGSGSVSSIPMTWSTVDAVPGFLTLSLQSANDGAIQSITVDGNNAFTANLARFGDTGVQSAGLVECNR